MFRDQTTRLIIKNQKKKINCITTKQNKVKNIKLVILYYYYIPINYCVYPRYYLIFLARL